ncbi:hypothetical protein C8R46DRAFT_1106289 [Mycena filopes]|nr:hypothetical protein C8R46DRAFT_1106289 [Mycena filopes]
MLDWLSLPVEIWLHILGLQQPLRNLTALCLTCSRLLSVARPVFYRQLHLVAEKNRTPNVAVLETFALLARDTDLAQSVRELTLDSHSTSESYVKNPGLVHVDSLRNMTQLKRVTVIGDMNSISLTPGARAFVLALTPLQLTQLANPKHIEFFVGPERNELLLPRVSTILTAAASSLTSLFLVAGQAHLKLRSLAIVNIFDWREIACPPGFSTFLSAHHEQLEKLHLGHYPLSSGYHPNAIILDESSVHPHFLPNLQVFSGHHQNIEIMARARMHCLKNLRDLTIGTEMAPPSEITLLPMLDALDTAGPLSALRDLDFDLFQSDETELATASTFVSRWAALCGPTLEVWRGLIPFMGSWPLDAFSAFPRLRIIHFPHDDLAPALAVALTPDTGAPPAYIPESVRGITRICSALEEVNIVRNLQDPTQNTSWMVDRRSPSGTELRRVE